MIRTVSQCPPACLDDRQLVAVKMAFEADPFPPNSLVTAQCNKTMTVEALQAG